MCSAWILIRSCESWSTQYQTAGGSPLLEIIGCQEKAVSRMFAATSWSEAVCSVCCSNGEGGKTSPKYFSASLPAQFLLFITFHNLRILPPTMNGWQKTKLRCKESVWFVFTFRFRSSGWGGGGEGGGITLVAVTINPCWGLPATNTSFLDTTQKAHVFLKNTNTNTINRLHHKQKIQLLNIFTPRDLTV